VRDGDVWTVTLGNRFRQNDTNQYGLSATYRLTRELSLLSDITFDAYEHRLSNMEAGLHQQSRSGWGFFYGITRREGDERNSSNPFTSALPRLSS
jgi:lipopolysaccharide assembly outer membrane protein LptD (OstA)